MKIVSYSDSVIDMNKTIVIAVVNSKGGVGKTTTAVLLSQALCEFGEVELRDADPQGSASEWVERALDEGILPFMFSVVNRRTLSKPSEARWVVIDTPPGKPETVDAAIEAADFIIIPTASTGVDVERMWATLEATQGKPRAVLITRARSNTRGLQALLDIFESESVPQFETMIPQREVIAQAFGRTSIDAEVHGYSAVARELMEVLV